MKIMISQPMGGISESEILKRREQVSQRFIMDGHEVLDTYYTFECPITVLSPPLFCLGASLMDMAKADAVYFCKGWENARGCIIEHSAATAYGIAILYEE